MVILVKIRNFSRSRMTKQTNTSNFVEFRDSRNFMFFEARGVGCRKTGL